MERILMTGAGGFLGGAVLNKLCALPDVEILAAVSGRRTHCFPQAVRPVTLDLLDPVQTREQLEALRPDICLHFAWDQSPDYRQSPENLRWLAASVQLLERFAGVGGRTFLFAGSSSEYEGRAGGVSEDERPRAMSLYGRCKRAFSELALDVGADLGLRVQIARYFTVYGFGNPHTFGGIPAAIRSFLQGKPFLCKAPEAIRDFIEVEDAAEATLRLLQSQQTGVVNVASGQPRRMREVFTEIAAQMDCAHLLQFAESAARQILAADTTKLHDTLGFRCRTDLTQGLAREIAWWRSRAGKGNEENGV